ncbi:MAG TPA: CBS domain-containing protein [Candidatus Nanoarchaeia archaeon]|nr:CBS domain-containing protein [Candidatus Nanoarchaeia archaeon]
MKVSQIMRKAVITDDTVSVKQAAKMMSSKGIGSLIIVKDNKIIGIVTEKDIVKNLDKIDFKLSSIMSKRVITIPQDAEVEKAAEIMKNNRIKRIPVMKDGKLVGLLSITDVIGHTGNEHIDDGDFFLN